MDSNGKAIVTGEVNSKMSSNPTVVSSTGSTKRSDLTSALAINEGEKKIQSSSGVLTAGSVSSKRKGKAIVNLAPVLLFRDVKLGPYEGEVRFRLLHFWEARNVLTKVLIGIEMLLIDEEGTVIQGFIPPGRIETYLPHMVAGGVYRLNNFYGSHSKSNYRVADPEVTISLSWNSVLSILDDSSVQFPEDRFRFHRYEDFESGCDLKGDLYDFVGHIKLVNGQKLSDSLVLDEDELASSPRILLHAQTYDGPVMKFYLWDKIAESFLQRFKSQESCPTVILVTTLNPKRFGGALSLSTLSSSRVYTDSDVEPTREYMTWLSSNSDVASRVNAEVVTKTETVTIRDLLSYVKQGGSKVAWFECEATVDDVVCGSPWYYIGCGVCHSKATKGSTTLMCKKCRKADIVGVAQYLTKLSVYDHTDQASFVLLGDAGVELTGMTAAFLVEHYFENKEADGDEHLVPVPQALIDTIGHTRKFIVKVSKHNLAGQVQSFTVTKVLQPRAQKAMVSLEESVHGSAGEEASHMEKHDHGPSVDSKGSVNGIVKRGSEVSAITGAKRPRCD